MTGPGWFTMQYSGSSTSKLSLAPNVTSDVYIMKSASGDPNNFVWDFNFKNVAGNITLDADGLGLTSGAGYSVAVYVNAVNETANQLLPAELKIFFSQGASHLAAITTSILTLAALQQF